MEFINETLYQADALWGPHQESSFGVCVIAKATFEVSDGGMVRTLEKPWPVHFQNMETPYGVFPSEYNPFPKARTDVIVCGFARPVGGKPVRVMEVKISVGDFHYAIRVFGNRVWEKQGWELVSSEPEFFTQMPLTLSHAYGGKITNEWGEMSHMYNSEGKGWYPEEAQARNAPLPNLEDPTRLIQSFRDQPPPVAPCPNTSAGGLKIEHPINPLGPERIVPMSQSTYCIAHPDLMLGQPVIAGQSIRVDGIRAEGPFEATVPTFGAKVRIEFGDDTLELFCKLDTIIILGEVGRIVFRWRGAGTFPLRPREKRRIRLVPGEEGRFCA